MFYTIYIESEIKSHPRTLEILVKLNLDNVRVIEINKYQDVFNRKNQNFRFQKEHGQNLIIAKKHGDFIKPIPCHNMSDTKENYYFSTSLNCIYDCKYCFLQGMYKSANIVVFVNYEDFWESILDTVSMSKAKSDLITFHAGYDNDSFALENIFGSSEFFINKFKKYPNIILELRTKSTNIDLLLDIKPVSNIVPAWTLTPSFINKHYELKAPSLISRLKAIQKVQKKGWKVGLRFEPLIRYDNYEEDFTDFILLLAKYLDFDLVKNITYDRFKIPKQYMKRMRAIVSWSRQTRLVG